MTIREAKQLNMIYKEFFNKRNCKNLLKILNPKSTVDFVLSSGGTSIIGEAKERSVPSYQYSYFILEDCKYKDLVTASDVFGDAPIFYINFFADGCIFIWEIKPDIQYGSVTRKYQKSNSNPELVEKKTYTLSYNDADLIISQKTWNSVSKDNYKFYYESKRQEHGLFY
jgi:hypothetical protein